MKILMVRPMEHPVEMDIPNKLEEYYKVLECETITATYPWEEPIALVTDDNGFFSKKRPSRFVEELNQPIMGNFFLCGLGDEDFADLPEKFVRKFKERFWKPELIFTVGDRLSVVQIDDGTMPK
ncbi:MAG: DUF3846 domain-containing protein [Lachnospiraceae bacterium]|nr:DUF3846 domain-containing protein [Lachnospiraceae bacterium]